MFGAHRMVLISDALRCCGMPDGEYELGGQQVFLSGGVARLADGTIAGSATNLFDCMTRAISFGIAPEDAIRAASWNPACALGTQDEVGSIAPGKWAILCVCGSGLYPETGADRWPASVKPEFGPTGCVMEPLVSVRVQVG